MNYIKHIEDTKDHPNICDRPRDSKQFYNFSLKNRNYHWKILMNKLTINYRRFCS